MKRVNIVRLKNFTTGFMIYAIRNPIKNGKIVFHKLVAIVCVAAQLLISRKIIHPMRMTTMEYMDIVKYLRFDSNLCFDAMVFPF